VAGPVGVDANGMSDRREGEAMKDVLPSPISLDVAGGFVARSDRLYAHDLVASLCGSRRHARGWVVLGAHTEPDGSTAASADAILVLDEYRLLCAGSVATTMRDAIEGLAARLWRQVLALDERRRALTQSMLSQTGTSLLAAAGPEPARWLS
jgi:hypothetical protein